jgi:hypothetical protein
MSYFAQYWFLGQARPLPDVSELFATRDHPHMLEIDVHGVKVNCHFFESDEIELDIDPREVVDESRHQAVLRFLEELALQTLKPVLLTAENTPEAPLLSFDPCAKRWQVHPLDQSAA